MMTLNEIAIYSGESIIEFRNKLLYLFPELGYKTMECVRLVTKISDLSRHVARIENSFNIKIAFQRSTHGNELLVIFCNLKTSINSINKLCQFPNANYFPNEAHTHMDVILPFAVLNSEIKLDKNRLNELKEKLLTKTKTELTREILHKNEELNKLIQDLKNSANLIQAEKMRALGVLTAGVAHELNNPMMGILNFIQYCIKKTSEEDKRFEVLKEAERETKRCIDIVSNLLTFSHLEKEEETNLQPVDLSIIIRRVINFLSFRIRNEKVTVIENLQPNLPTINGLENRLQQVILNLITNALDAMKTTALKELRIKMHTDSDSLSINISDTGIGMDKETQEKIFEPFFTTKPAGLGTGLGLSVCESIIKEHHGVITCYSEKNKGTQFYIRLPLT